MCWLNTVETVCPNIGRDWEISAEFYSLERFRAVDSSKNWLHTGLLDKCLIGHTIAAELQTFLCNIYTGKKQRKKMINNLMLNTFALWLSSPQSVVWHTARRPLRCELIYSLLNPIAKDRFNREREREREKDVY